MLWTLDCASLCLSCFLLNLSFVTVIGYLFSTCQYCIAVLSYKLKKKDTASKNSAWIYLSVDWLSSSSAQKRWRDSMKVGWMYCWKIWRTRLRADCPGGEYNYVFAKWLWRITSQSEVIFNSSVYIFLRGKYFIMVKHMAMLVVNEYASNCKDPLVKACLCAPTNMQYPFPSFWTFRHLLFLPAYFFKCGFQHIAQMFMWFLIQKGYSLFFELRYSLLEKKGKLKYCTCDFSM